MRSTRERLGSTALAALGAGVGLVVAAIVTMNLHIWVGLEQGYAASPAEVFERSIVLGLVDIVLLVGLPAAGILAARKLRHASSHPPG
jgi:hypothetical protein